MGARLSAPEPPLIQNELLIPNMYQYMENVLLSQKWLSEKQTENKK
jgi:hypothetical protein